MIYSNYEQYRSCINEKKEDNNEDNNDISINIIETLNIMEIIFYSIQGIYIDDIKYIYKLKG